ncbi:MAG: cell envelope integrity protein TolA [Kiloniellaceae bacterium]
MAILSGISHAVGSRLGSGLREGAVLSGLLHTLVMAVLIFGLPVVVEPPTDTVIPIEMVVLEEEPAPEPEPEPKPEPVAEEPPPKPEPPTPEAKPPPPEPEPEPEPAPPPPEAKPEPKKEIVQPLPPKPRRRPQIKLAKPKQPEKRPDQLTSILRNVEKMKDAPRPRREQTAKAEPRGTSYSASAFERNEMVHAIQRQLFRCWRLDPGARDAHDLVVEIRVTLNPDGSVRNANIVDIVRTVQDSYFRSAAENARRAILTCSPFQLPPKKYNIWRQLTLRFNPREMFGT